MSYFSMHCMQIDAIDLAISQTQTKWFPFPYASTEREGVNAKCPSIKHDHCSDLLNFEKGFKASDADKNNERLRSDEIDNNIIFSSYHTPKICIFWAKSQTPIFCCFIVHGNFEI